MAKGNISLTQKQALQWCLDREYPKLPTKEKDKPVQFWQLKKTGNKVCMLVTIFRKYLNNIFVRNTTAIVR